MNNNHFTILIPSFNSQAWAEKSLKSVFSQRYNNFDIYYIDDHSSDNTREVVERLFETLDFSGQNKTFVHNSFNKGKMSNVFYAMKELRDDTVVVMLDGDDWLHDENVLSFLNEAYDEDTWMTCGSYVTIPHGDIVKPNLAYDYWDGDIRKRNWEFSHLGTFRKALFDNIKKKDFMNKTGQFFSTTSDQAIMWPMAEMSGPEHFKAIEKVLYCYNLRNPISDHVAHRSDQLLTEHDIRNRKPYDRKEVL